MTLERFVFIGVTSTFGSNWKESSDTDIHLLSLDLQAGDGLIVRLLAFSSAYTQQLHSLQLYLHEVRMYLLQHSVTGCK